MKKRIKSDNAFESVLGFLALLGGIFLMYSFLAHYDKSEKADKRSAENSAIASHFEDKIIENIEENDVEGLNWNKKVEFTDKSIKYVSVECERNSESYDFECDVFEVKEESESLEENIDKNTDE